MPNWKLRLPSSKVSAPSLLMRYEKLPPIKIFVRMRLWQQLKSSVGTWKDALRNWKKL